MPTGTYLDDLPEEVRPRVLPSWDDVAKDFQGEFPDLDPKAMRSLYERAAKLQLARARRATTDDLLINPETVGTRAVPFVGSALSIDRDRAYSASMKRLMEGNPSEQDYKTIAQYEHTKAKDTKLSSTIPGAVADAGLRGVGTFGEVMATGGGALASQGVKTFSVEGAKQAAKQAAIEAVKTPLRPSMYAERGSQENLAAGRDPLHPAGQGKALALGAVQSAVMGAVNSYANRLVSGPGVQQAVARAGVQVATDPFAQQAADIVTSSVGLDAGYGTIGQILDGKTDDALKGLLVQAFTSAAFSLANERHGSGPHPLIRDVAEQLRQARRGGLSRDAAAQRIMDRLTQAQAESVSAPRDPNRFQSFPEGAEEAPPNAAPRAKGRFDHFRKLLASGLSQEEAYRKAWEAFPYDAPGGPRSDPEVQNGLPADTIPPNTASEPLEPGNDTSRPLPMEQRRQRPSISG